MKQLLFTKSLSIWCPDYSFRKLFSEKLVAFGYKISTVNMEYFEYLWLNESDPSLEDQTKEIEYTYGNGKGRWAMCHYNFDYRMELPQDWHKAMFYATEMVRSRSQKILRLFEERESGGFETI